MFEKLTLAKSHLRQERYEVLLPQIQAMVASETNLIAVLANTSAAIRQTFDFFWVGFYLKDSEKELVLGPFQGDIACTRIGYGKGVCGTAWQTQKTIIVDDVEQFEGHIACSALSKSEIVVPIFAEAECKGVLDIDSINYKEFNELDRFYLEMICGELSVRF